METISILILSLFLGASIYLATKSLLKCSERDEANKADKELLEVYRNANNRTYVHYYVMRTTGECAFPNVWAVYRQVEVDGHTIKTIIKIFTDEDDDFNYDEACDLRDMLSK